MPETSTTTESLPALVVSTPTEPLCQMCAFWRGVEMPYNAEDPEVQFINPVLVQEWIGAKTTDIATLNAQIEALTEETENLKVHRKRRERTLSKFRRSIAARLTYPASTTADRLAALVYEAVQDNESERLTLDNYERKVEEVQDEIDVRQPRIDLLKSRVKALADALNAAKQVLDFSKLEIRIQRGIN